MCAANWKTHFNLDWINADLNPEWANTLAEVKTNPFQAKCKTCSKLIELSNMGRQAIVSHFKSKQHQKKALAVKQTQSGILQQYINNSKTTATVNTSEVSDGSKTVIINNQDDKTSASTSKEVMKSFIRTENVIDAEILWCLNIVMKHKSLNSCKTDVPLMQRMFPDSEISKKMMLSPAKASYCILFGLSVYISEKLLADIRTCNKFVVCFDEALNKVAQRGQMDIFIRFWSNHDLVETRYLTSVFLNHASAGDILQKFKDGLQELNVNNIIQVFFS